MEKPLEIPPQIFETLAEDGCIIDVRTPEEFVGPEGHLPKATLAPLGSALLSFLETAPRTQTYLFVCAHGKRSLQAAQLAQEKGFVNVFSLQGGLHAWKKAGLSIAFEDKKFL